MTELFAFIVLAIVGVFWALAVLLGLGIALLILAIPVVIFIRMTRK